VQSAGDPEPVSLLLSAVLLIAIRAALGIPTRQPGVGLRGDAIRRPGAKRFPSLTITIALVLAFCLALQVAQPWLLTTLRRNADSVRTGEVWRLATALFFQDGWLAGGVFNIVSLVAVGAVAERRFGRRSWLLLYFGGAVIVEIIALRLQPEGAGNSIANFSLAGALLVEAGRLGSRTARVLGVIGFIPASLLVLRGDVHGAAILVGAGMRAAGWGLRTDG
jgi:membrane associated rhomboid family serine protease